MQAGAGADAGFDDGAYQDAGAEIVDSYAAACRAELVLRVGPPEPGEIDALEDDATLVGFMDPFVDAALVRAIADRGITAMAVEAIPRTTLAQAMDALSSQANIAGYAATLMAAKASPKLLPMMVTAAGTIAPSKALVLGVGVAGLQAIATARRLGAVVHAYDVRPETREQVESLGAKFVEAPTQAADEGGYATEVAADVQARQMEILAPYVADADLVVTTAQIPGRAAPRLISAEMIAAMRPGSVVVDMAAATGGNVEGSLTDREVVVGGVHIYGPSNLASSVAADASRMYARNLAALLDRIKTDDGSMSLDLEDEIVGQTAVVFRGDVRHPRCRDLLGLGPEETP